MPKYYVAETTDGYQLYGNALTFVGSRAHEAILSGPFESGKTVAALLKLHTLMLSFPSARGLMVRKTYKSIKDSACVTYEKKINVVPVGDSRCGIKKHGGEAVEFYDYPNGSRLYVGGMDNPDKFLSAEFDVIYVNQAEELTQDDWEKLVGRATGRAGNIPFSQVFGDCNPGGPTHWIKQREQLRVYESVHEDNPVLYNHELNEWTDQGKRTLAILDGLTGLRYMRGRLGLWVAAEGQVYNFEPGLHVVDRFDVPKDWARYRACDFGYQNPFVCLWFAADEDGRLYLYRQLYHTERTVKRHAEQIKQLSQGETYVATIADHDAEDRATLAENGINTVPADKRLLMGIDRMQERLAKAGDGRPRFFVMRDSLVEVDRKLRDARKPIGIEDEFSSYIYPSGANGKNMKEAPVKSDDHALDAARYMVMFLDNKALSGKPSSRKRPAIGI